MTHKLTTEEMHRLTVEEFRSSEKQLSISLEGSVG